MITTIQTRMRSVGRHLAFAVFAAAFLVTMTACDSGSVDETTPTTPLTVSFTTTSAASSASALAKRSVTDPSGNALEYTRVEMILEEVEFERDGSSNACREDRDDDPDDDDRDDRGDDEDDDRDDRDDGDDCEEVETGPFALDLPLTGSAPLAAFTTALPEGRWSEVEFEIEPLDDDDAGTLNTSVPVDASVRVEGLYTPAGEAPVSFVWVGDVDEEQEIEFEPPVTVTPDEPVNVTFQVDIDDWFRMDDGTLIDPREADDDSDLEDIVEDNIEDSIEGFQDDDRDGEDDDDEDDDDEDDDDEDDDDEDDDDEDDDEDDDDDDDDD